MSTFNGVIKEFPSIRIDYFRVVPNHPRPLACFLSHVHADHLQGLESLKAPFIYCSPATKEILLRLEKYPHRMNFTTGLLESRKQTYHHLRKNLKTIPIDTPTTIELHPGEKIQVTLIDANHCAGSCMFLIQGNNRAILYTGDIRAEPWWVQTICRSPFLIPYTLEHRGTGTELPRLDNVYLDTTFATKSDAYRTFPSKADGLRELLGRLQDYPSDIIFYFESWTFGYEQVWLMLASVLKTRIHLDRYRYSIYSSLTRSSADGEHVPVEGPALAGFRFGNHVMSGCVTDQSENVRIHSCERGTPCPALDDARLRGKVVRIVPIVNRLHAGAEICEIGLGGGNGDLDQIHELEMPDNAALGRLGSLCKRILETQTDDLKGVLRLLGDHPYSKRNEKRIRLNARGFLERQQHSRGEDINLTLKELVEILVKQQREFPASASPKEIRFPYSRHSSYEELCDLIGALRPRDIVPCTVPDIDLWSPDLSMRSLFGHLCSGQDFEHDLEMLQEYELLRAESRKRKAEEADLNDLVASHGRSCTSQSRRGGVIPSQIPFQQLLTRQDEVEPNDTIHSPLKRADHEPDVCQVETRRGNSSQSSMFYTPSSSLDGKTGMHQPMTDVRPPGSSPCEAVANTLDHTPSSSHSERADGLLTRRMAYSAALNEHGLTWTDMSLTCVEEYASEEEL